MEISRDIFGCHIAEAVLTGFKWVEVRDPTKYPTNNYMAQKSTVLLSRHHGLSKLSSILEACANSCTGGVARGNL